MRRIVSSESIDRANYNVRRGHSCVTGMDSSGVTAEFNTMFGRAKIQVSYSEVAEAGEKALSAYSK